MPDALDPEEYVGLATDAARDLAAQRGWHPRVVNPGDMVTMDYREDRVNLATDESGTVTRVYVG